MGICYLIHFSQPISERHSAQHYIGWCAGDVMSRLAIHRMGKGARLTQVANERGIAYDVVRVWEGADRQFERKLKKRKAAPRLCPICQASQFMLDDVEEVPF